MNSPDFLDEKQDHFFMGVRRLRLPALCSFQQVIVMKIILRLFSLWLSNHYEFYVAFCFVRIGAQSLMF